jgi:Flp pilus assembly protein TadD
MWHDDLRLFAATVEVSPHAPRAWLNYAVQLQRAGDLPRAEAAFRESLRLGLSAEALTALGGLYDTTGRPAEAERMLRRALDFKPDDRTALRNAAVFYGRHHRFDQAIALLQPYVARHPDDADLAGLLRYVQSLRDR